MAVRITEIIPRQNFELVGERIGEILFEELANQKVLQPARLPEDHKVFFERIIAVNHTEEVVIIVNFDSFITSYATQSDTQAETNYFVDLYASGKEEEGIKGDEVAATKLLKWVGLCRYILQSHKYVTLGFAPGSIGGKRVDNILMDEQSSNKDTTFSRMCRINFSVRIMENQALWDGILLDQQITKTKLELTDLGYQYKLKP